MANDKYDLVGSTNAKYAAAATFVVGAGILWLVDKGVPEAPEEKITTIFDREGAKERNAS